MKTKLTTTIAALLLATSAQANGCHSALTTTRDLRQDLQDSMEQYHEKQDTATQKQKELMARSILRRANSVKSSLLSIRVFCHDNAPALSLANRTEDIIDELLTP